MAKADIAQGAFEEAIGKLEQAQEYPHNLGEGKLSGARENELFYLLGLAFEKLGQQEKATSFFSKATIGSSEPAAAMFYNDQQPDKILYQGLAWKKLGEEDMANHIFRKLIEYGNTHLDDRVKIDYFAVSLPDLLIFEDDLQMRNQLHCHYITGLGFLGLGKMSEAKLSFKKVLKGDAMHFGAKAHLGLTMNADCLGVW